MAISFSQTASLTCPQCNTPFDAEIWLSIDAGERPDLAARCHDGSIHVVTCPNEHSGMLGAPLLYHDRAKQQLFLAYPQGMSEQQIQQAGGQLVQQLRSQLLALPNSSYLDAPQAIPIELLPAAMDDKLDEAMAELQAQFEKLRNDPAIAAAARVLQEHRALGETIQEWMNLDAWNTSKQFLAAHPELLTNDAELVLAAMLDLARAQEDADAQEDLEVHREILRVARQDGIDAAYQKYLERGASEERSAGDGREPDARAQLQARLAELNIHSQEELERALSAHLELQELFARAMRDENPILQAVEKLIEARSPQEVIQLARAYPMLLEDEGLNAIREIISNARERGDEDMANHLQERFAILEQIKASGMPVDELVRQASLVQSLDDETRAAFEEMRALGISNEQELAAALEKRPDLRAKLEVAAARAAPSSNLGDIPDDVRPILQEMSRLTRLPDMPRKIELCRAALERVTREQNPNLWAALENELANALAQNPQGSRADNLEAAIRHYELALEVRTRAAFPEDWATTQNNLANAYNQRIRGERADNLEAAIRHYELALEVYTRAAFPEDWAMTQNNLAAAYSDRIRGERADNLEQAIRHYELALEVYTRAAFPEDWGMTQNNLANAYRNRIRGERADNLEQAMRHYELALEVYTRAAFPEQWAGTQNNLGEAYRNRIRGEQADNLEEAIRHYERALEVYTRAAFPEDWAMTQNNLAAAYSDRIRGERADNLEQAIRHYELALEVYTRAAFPEQWAGTQNNLANAYRNRIRGERADNLEQAIRHFELALEVYTRAAFPEQWAGTQNNLGEAYRNRIRGEQADNLEEAIRHYELALEVYTRAAFPEQWAGTQNNLGEAYRNRIRGERADNLEEAIRHYELALEVRTRAAFPEQWAGTQNSLANAYRNRIRGERADNLEQAIRHFEQALEEYKSERFPERARTTALNLAAVGEEREDWRAVHRALTTAAAAGERLFLATISQFGEETEAQELARLYDRDLRACLRLVAADAEVARDALSDAEAARSRAFLRQLSLGDFAPPASIPAPLVAQEKNILAQLRETQNDLARLVTPRDRKPETERTLTDRMSEMELTLTDRRKKLGDELERVWNEMLSASPDAADYVSLRRAETPKWNDLSALAARLGQDTALRQTQGVALVEFHVLSDQTLAFVWRAGWDAPKMLSLPLTRDKIFNRYLQSYEREVLNIYRREQAQASGRELYHDWLGLGEELLAPLVERRSDGTSLLGDASLVYFIPHQFLHLLPLHALTVNGEPFIARRAVAYAPSAAVLKRVLDVTGPRRSLAQETLSRLTPALVMGYTEYAWQRDVFNGEAIEVAKLFGAQEIVDENATRAALAQRAPTASLIHLSCHGKFDRNDSLNSGVELADGLFTARDWMRLNLRAELVTLSACQLAFSRLNPGDDLVGMTRALMYAGASSVLLALWSVYADTTLEWMLDFYKRIRANGDAQAKAFAFRDATLALRAQDDDPYVWAPFVLVGDWM